MVTLNATVFPDEAYVLVEVDWGGMLLFDDFSRTEVATWGSPNIGPAYVPFGGVAANFFVNGSRGVISHSTLATRGVSIPISVLNARMSGTFQNTVIPTGGNFEVEFTLRYVDANNFVQARLFLTTANAVSMSIRQVVGGVETNGGFPGIAGLTTTDNIAWIFEADGSELRFKAWLASATEPATWNDTLTTTWLTAGQARVSSTLTGGVTNPLPVSHFFDNLLIDDLDSDEVLYGTVTRRNTVTGEIVTLRPYIAYDADGNLLLECGQGLWWDTEPPLNVPLEYCAVAADVATAISLNPFFETDVTSWTALNGSIAQNCSVSHEGTCSMEFTPNGTSYGPGVFQFDTTTLVPGVEATFSTWARTAQGWNGVRLVVVLTYSDGTFETIQTPVEILDDTEWRFLTGTVTPRTTVNSWSLLFTASGIPPNTTLFQLDEFMLTQPQAVSSTACETVTVSSESVWLKSPLNPCSDVEIGLCSPMLDDCEADARVSYVGTSQEDYTQNTVLLLPTNRPRPIAMNRVRRDAAATLQLLAHDCDARDAVLLANEPGDPLLFQAPATYCIPDRYISVGVESVSKIGVDQRDDFRLISLPYVVVDRPEGPANGVCGARIRDLCDIYTSWAAMNIAGLTWTDLLLGEASPNGPGQPEPPEDQRTWDEVEAEFANWTAVTGGGTRDWDELRDGL